MIRSGLCHGGGARSQPSPGQAWHQNGQEGLAARIRLDGGLGLERARAPSRQRGPSPWPTGQDSGPKALPGSFSFRGSRANKGTNLRAVSLSYGGRALREAGSAVRSPSGDIMACTVCD